MTCLVDLPPEILEIIADYILHSRHPSDLETFALIKRKYSSVNDIGGPQISLVALFHHIIQEPVIATHITTAVIPKHRVVSADDSNMVLDGSYLSLQPLVVSSANDLPFENDDERLKWAAALDRGEQVAMAALVLPRLVNLKTLDIEIPSWSGPWFLKLFQRPRPEATKRREIYRDLTLHTVTLRGELVGSFGTLDVWDVISFLCLPSVRRLHLKNPYLWKTRAREPLPVSGSSVVDLQLDNILLSGNLWLVRKVIGMTRALRSFTVYGIAEGDLRYPHLLTSSLLDVARHSLECLTVQIHSYDHYLAAVLGDLREFSRLRYLNTELRLLLSNEEQSESPTQLTDVLPASIEHLVLTQKQLLWTEQNFGQLDVLVSQGLHHTPNLTRLDFNLVSNLVSDNHEAKGGKFNSEWLATFSAKCAVTAVDFRYHEKNWSFWQKVQP